MAVAGVRVGVFRQSEIPRSVDTDARGNAEFSGLGPGVWQVRWEFAGGQQNLTTHIFAGYATDLRLVLPAGAAVEGTVRHMITGAVEGETVKLSSVDGGARTTLKTRTDRNGRYTFESVPPGFFSINLASSVSTQGSNFSSSLFVAPGQRIRKDFVVGPLLGGTVRELRTSLPIEGARVELRQGGRTLASATTDAGGIFSFAEMAPLTATLVISKEGYGLTVLRDVAISEDGRMVDVEMPQAARLRLRVIDSHSEPISGSVSLSVRPLPLDEGTSSIGATVSLDVNGRGLYNQIGPGTYELYLSAENRGWVRLSTTLVPGDNELEVRLQVK